MKSNSKAIEIKQRFSAQEKKKTKEQKLEIDALMLMAGYLSEIELVQKQKGIKRNKLAELIETSASYLTQVFRGDKPLNFTTVAKIQDVLGIRFSVQAHYVNPLINGVFNSIDSDEVNMQRYQHKFFQSKFADVIAYEKTSNSASSDTIPSQSTVINI